MPKVDHEYYVMQGDFCTVGKYRQKGLQAFDMEKAIDERPTPRALRRGRGSAHGREGHDGDRSAPGAAPLPGKSVYHLPVALTDQNGKAFHRAEERGAPTVVSMFYTSCQFTCPMLIEAMRANEEKLAPAERARLKVLLVSFDPEHDTVAEIAQIRALRDSSRSNCLIEVGLSTAFGCTIQGPVAESEVLRLLQAVLDAGADRVGLADTVGYADPLQVKRRFEAAFAIAGDRLACGHFHDTRGLGLANVFAAWETGVRRFDACTAGIGGCPHAPGASGNVSTEDMAYLFASMGVSTGLDFGQLIALRARVAQWLDGETLHGTVWRAGLPKTLRPGGPSAAGQCGEAMHPARSQQVP